MSSSEKPSIDRLLFAAFVLGLCLLTFVGGAVALRYGLPGSRLLVEAFDSIEAWNKRIKVIVAEPPSQASLDKAVANPKVVWDKQKSFNGYTLYTTWSGSRAFLVDMEGKLVHEWHMPFSQVWPNPPQVAHPAVDGKIFWEKAQALPDGSLVVSYISLGDTPYGYGMAKIDKDSKLLWKYDSNTHHDFYIDQGAGNVYTLTQSLYKKPEAGFEKLPYPMLADAVAILSRDGQELKKIRLIDAFKDTPYELMLYYGRNGWDQFHANSIQKLEPEMAAKFPMFKAGAMLVSLRNMGALVVIDPDTNKVVWARYGMWKMQHAAHFLPNGHIMLLDNRGHTQKGRTFSRVIEFDPATEGVTWSFVGDADQPFYTQVIGRTQRLANGNTMITSGLQSRIFEVTPDGKIVWSYVLPKLAGTDNRQANANQRGKKNKQRGRQIGSNGRNVTIVSAMRYAPEELPFLSKEPQKP